MPLPKKTAKILSKRLSLMDDAVDNFDVTEEEIKVFKALRRFLIKVLDVDKDGNIKRTAKNLRAVQDIKKLRNIILSDGYKAKVGKYIATFNKVRSESDKYIKEL